MFTYLLLLGVVIGNMVAQLQACTQNRWKKIFVFSGTSAVISTTKFMIKKKKNKEKKSNKCSAPGGWDYRLSKRTYWTRKHWTKQNRDLRPVRISKSRRSLVMTTKGARKRAPHAFLCGVYDWHKSWMKGKHREFALHKGPVLLTLTQIETRPRKQLVLIPVETALCM